MTRLCEIELRLKELRALLKERKAEDPEACEKEIEELGKEKKTMEEIKNPTNEEVEIDVEKEYRSAFFKNLLGKEMTTAEQRAFSISGTAGAVPTETVNQIIAKAKQIAPMLDEITLLHFPGAVNFAVEGTRNAASLHTENQSQNDSADTLVQITLGAYEMIKIIKVSETVKLMTVSGFETWLVDQLATSVAELIDSYIVSGTGTSQPKGIANAATWVDGTNAVQWNSATALAVADILEAVSYLPGRYDKGAKFYMSKKTFWRNVMPLRDDAKAPIVKEQGGKYYIYGYEIALDDYFADAVIYLGNAKYIYGNLGENISVRSDASAGFTSASVVYRGLAIFDCKPAVDDAFVKIAATIA